jgi:Predicted membrane protein
MAKFCENCGAAMDDGDAVCGQCGTPVGSVGGVAPQTNSGTVNSQPQANNGESKASNANNSAFIGKIVCAVIALIVVIGIVNVVGKSSSYDTVLKKMVKAIKNDDTDAFINISSQVGQAIHNEQYGEGSYEDMIDNFLETKLDNYEDQVDGKVKSITYKIKDKQEITDRKLKKVKDTISDQYDVDADDISNMMNVTLKLKIKGKDETTKDDLDNVVLIKEKGKWKVYIDYMNDFN